MSKILRWGESGKIDCDLLQLWRYTQIDDWGDPRRDIYLNAVMLSFGNAAAALHSLQCGPATPWETPDGIPPNRHGALPGLRV